MPSKALSVSMENIWTDLFLILSVFLFAGNLIFEEKREKAFLYYTKYEKRAVSEYLCQADSVADSLYSNCGVALWLQF